MKFSEITKFKSWGNYQVNVPLRYIKSSLDRYNDDSSLELNPDFQRGHVWTEQQQREYVEFFLRGGKSGRDIFFNCSSWMGNFNTPVQCVDGLQRITACLKFMDNELAIFDGHYLSDFEDGTIFIDNTLIFHVNNLKSRKDVLQWYFELNNGGVVHSDEELARVKKMIEDED
jgi:uncharacterized protein with ParB-like and HNH nuclease domain